MNGPRQRMGEEKRQEQMRNVVCMDGEFFGGDVDGSLAPAGW